MAGSAHSTRGISIFFHKIMEPSLKKTLHILKDTFNFAERKENDLEIGTIVGVANIKSLYTNISHNLGLRQRILMEHLKLHSISYSVIFPINRFPLS